MANGFVQRYKGKIATVLGGIFQSGVESWASFVHAGAPVNGTSGTLAKIAKPGALLLDTTNAVLYQNSNTLLSPTWTALTTSTGAGTYTGTFDGIVGGNTPAAATVTTLTASGLVVESVGTGITAATTQTRAAATALTKQVNNVATVANSGDAVKLAAATVGLVQIVFNSGANPASVFPNGASDTIDGGSAAAAVTLTNAKRAAFFCVAANTWLSAQLGVASA